MGLCRSRDKKHDNYSLTFVGKLQDSNQDNVVIQQNQKTKQRNGNTQQNQNTLSPQPKKNLTFEQTLCKFFDKNYRFKDRGTKSQLKLLEYHKMYQFKDSKEYFTEQQQKQIFQSILYIKETPRWAQYDFKKIHPVNLQQIGKGSFGTVYKAYDNANKLDIVIKRIQIKKLDEKERQNLYKEIELLQVLKNVNIVEFYGHNLQQDYLDIYQEYVDLGSILSYINLYQKFPEPLVAFFSSQILQGLKYLHGKNLLHRDIKPANLVFNKQGILKLIDFGLTKHLDSKDKSSAGTLAYMSPEMYRNEKNGRFSDIWSFGCTVLQMLTGRLLCSNKQQLKEQFQTQQEDYWFLNDQQLSILAKDFIFCCLRKKDYERKNVVELLDHPFLQLQYFLKQSEMWSSVYTYSSIFGLQKMATKKGIQIQQENEEIKFSQVKPTYIQSEIHYPKTEQLTINYKYIFNHKIIEQNKKICQLFMSINLLIIFQIIMYQQISTMFGQCQQTFSYPNYPSLPPTIQILNNCYFTTQNYSSNLEFKICRFPEMNGMKKFVVYIGVNLRVPYKGQEFPVVSKILFPPRFPVVPPIFSVVNLKETQFQVNPQFRHYKLPDSTYEVKLLGAYHWKSNFDFKSLIQEFVQTLSVNFPFFKSKTTLHPSQPPVFYDPRYDNPDVAFPFDYNLDNRSELDLQSLQNSQRNRQNSHNYNQSNSMPHQQQDYQQQQYRDQPHQSQQGYRDQRRTSQPQNTSAISNTIKDIQDQFTQDISKYEKSLQFLIEKNDQLKVQHNLVETKIQNLPYLKEKLALETNKLENQYKQMNQIDLNTKTLEKLLVFDNDKDKNLFTLKSNLKANINSQMFLQDTFLADVGEYEDVEKELVKLWKDEFDMKLQKKVLQNS